VRAFFSLVHCSYPRAAIGGEDSRIWLPHRLESTGPDRPGSPASSMYTGRFAADYGRMKYESHECWVFSRDVGILETPIRRVAGHISRAYPLKGIRLSALGQSAGAVGILSTKGNIGLTRFAGNRGVRRYGLSGQLQTERCSLHHGSQRMASKGIAVKQITGNVIPFDSTPIKQFPQNFRLLNAPKNAKNAGNRRIRGVGDCATRSLRISLQSCSRFPP
jgi:hypothetical protein